MKTTLRVTMPDGTKWDVYVMLIARHRAAHYAHEFGGDVERSLREDTIPLFESNPYQIQDWAENNMNWDDVKDYAAKVNHGPNDEYLEGWVNGKKELL